MQAAYVALRTLAAVMAERGGGPLAPAPTREQLDTYIAQWQDDFVLVRRDKADVLAVFDEAIARLEWALS